MKTERWGRAVKKYARKHIDTKKRIAGHYLALSNSLQVASMTFIVGSLPITFTAATFAMQTHAPTLFVVGVALSSLATGAIAAVVAYVYEQQGIALLENVNQYPDSDGGFADFSE
jgi:hypothetical protein